MRELPHDDRLRAACIAGILSDGQWHTRLELSQRMARVGTKLNQILLDTAGVYWPIAESDSGRYYGFLSDRLATYAPDEIDEEGEDE